MFKRFSLLQRLQLTLLFCASVQPRYPRTKVPVGKEQGGGKVLSAAERQRLADSAIRAPRTSSCETKFADKWLSWKPQETPRVSTFRCPIRVQDSMRIRQHRYGARRRWLVRCGNGLKDGNDSCDGSDLDGKTCTSFGFAGGTLACTASCGFDTASCNPVLCGNGAIDAGEECDQDNLNGETCPGLGYATGTLTCGAGCLFNEGGCYTDRFVDNSDGTITDNQTGLMWEKKADLDNVPVNCTSDAVCPNPHDADNSYTWTDNNDPTSNPTGTAFTVFCRS
jgi:hypothetical protein